MRSWLKQLIENEGIESTGTRLSVMDPFHGNSTSFRMGARQSSLSGRQLIDSQWKDSFPEIRWHLGPEAHISRALFLTESQRDDAPKIAVHNNFRIHRAQEARKND